MVNGRDKGSRGEKMVAHIIRDWWAGHEPASLFIRTPLSGGWQHNTRAAAHFKASGDLMTTSQTFPFCVEVKWREAWSVNNFLDGKPTGPWDWWQQAIEAAVKQGSVPMMWMRRNRIPGTREPFPWIVLLPQEFVEAKVLDAPDMIWSKSQLIGNGVLISVHPAGYDFRRFIKMDPTRMLKERRRGHEGRR